MQKITPFLWFDTQAEEAAQFYCSIFKNSRVNSISHYGPGSPMPEGTAMSVAFTLDGQDFMALNGGPEFKFTEAISMFVNCETQVEADELWEKLTEGGQEVQCGWLKDKYGLSWQIVPTDMFKYIGGPDAEGARRAMQAMLQMKKLDIVKLKQAYEKG
jgi:predicted 3-demethylubiquinone-9 3-methyltransferase (glyoxalase superfamily)